MFLSIGKTTLYMIELIVGFETNLNSNAERKHEKYHQLTRDLSSDFHNDMYLAEWAVHLHRFWICLKTSNFMKKLTRLLSKE